MRVNGPVACTGTGVRKICEERDAFKPLLSGSAVVAAGNVPSDLKFSAEVNMMEPGLNELL